MTHGHTQDDVDGSYCEWLSNIVNEVLRDEYNILSFEYKETTSQVRDYLTSRERAFSEADEREYHTLVDLHITLVSTGKK